MFSWFSSVPEEKQMVYDNVTEGLKNIYKTKLLPLEEYHNYHDLYSPQLNDADFDAKPMIILVGPYSTGKTTFIRYLLGREFPGMRIGPEPTTDRFCAVMYSETEGTIPGNALVGDSKRQFRPLDKFGNSFLSRFQCCLVNSPVLQRLSIVDTPGILAGEKHRMDRGYDFAGVLEWFAERVDRILIFFDAHTLDISDECYRSLEALRGHDEKIRIVLNKADQINNQQLIRVYGALMWSLGKVLQTPEVARVYIGTFWDQPLNFDVNRSLFDDETEDLFQDLQSLPKNSALRKLNDLSKRARIAKVHAYITAELKAKMPFFRKESKKYEMLRNLRSIYEKLQEKYKIAAGDFPELQKMQVLLEDHDFMKFRGIKTRLIEGVDVMLKNDISSLMELLPHEQCSKNDGEPFEDVWDPMSPFGYKRGEGTNAGFGEPYWVVEKKKVTYDNIFDSLKTNDGKVTGSAARLEMQKSKLPNPILGKIWKLADVDNDGMLDRDEFALAMHLIHVKLSGSEIPAILPDHLVPPSKSSSKVLTELEVKPISTFEVRDELEFETNSDDICERSIVM